MKKKVKSARGLRRIIKDLDTKKSVVVYTNDMFYFGIFHHEKEGWTIWENEFETNEVDDEYRGLDFMMDNDEVVFTCEILDSVEDMCAIIRKDLQDSSKKQLEDKNDLLSRIVDEVKDLIGKPVDDTFGNSGILMGVSMTHEDYYYDVVLRDSATGKPKLTFFSCCCKCQRMENEEHNRNYEKFLEENRDEVLGTLREHYEDPRATDISIIHI